MDNFYHNLDYLDLVLVKGKDSGKFLQGQLTCDVDAITDLQSCLGAACNNKGRVFSNFRLSRLNGNIYLEMQQGLQGIFKSSLDKFIPFYKAEIEDGRSHFNRIGLAGTNCIEPLTNIFPELPCKDNQFCTNNGAYLLRLSENPPRFILWSANKLNPSELFPQLQRGQKEDWEKLDFDAGIYPFHLTDVNQYTPEELNLDLNNAISFTKGCYTGQEIVARMHYRGKAKKRLYHIHIHSEEKINIGDTVYDQEQKKLGEILKLLEIHSEKSASAYHYQAFAILKAQPVIVGEQTHHTPTSLSATTLPIEACSNAIVISKL